jgi:hypothetical protein
MARDMSLTCRPTQAAGSTRRVKRNLSDEE